MNAMSKYQVRYPVGFSLSSPGSAGGALDGAPLNANSEEVKEVSTLWDRFHLKGIGSNPSARTDTSGNSIGLSAPRIMTVYLPLVAVVIPEWLHARTLSKKGRGVPKAPRANHGSSDVPSWLGAMQPQAALGANLCDERVDLFPRCKGEIAGARGHTAAKDASGLVGNRT